MICDKICIYRQGAIAAMTKIDKEIGMKVWDREIETETERECDCDVIVMWL